MTEFKTLLGRPEYAFLREDPRLGKRIMLLGVSGSHGYGTNREDSDVDLRGVTLNLPSDLLGLTAFEQYEERKTDTVVYGFMKMVRLLLDCNPNIIEILGLDDDQYLIRSDQGEDLLTHRDLFLSARAADSFGHYAAAQLRRLQNAVARDKLTQAERERHIYNSVKNALRNFTKDHDNWEKGSLRLYIDAAETAGLDEEIFMDADFRHYPLRQYNEAMNTMTSVVREYDRVGHRNHKKDDNHLNKHAMHLVRLFMTGIDILEKGEIRTRRSGDDLDLLLRIRNGEFMEDGMFVPEFYAIVSEYERRFEAARKTTNLPDRPDMDKVGAFVERINRKAIEENFS